jgi:hypothetical protein
MEIEKEIECALSAGGDWADLYRCHLRAVKQPLTFKQYKAMRREWDKVTMADPTDRVAIQQQAELEAALGL